MTISRAARWARLVFGGKKHRWHLFEGPSIISACERQWLNYQRDERREGGDPPPDGKACGFCLAILAKRARREAGEAGLLERKGKEKP